MEGEEYRRHLYLTLQRAKKTVRALTGLKIDGFLEQMVLKQYVEAVVEHDFAQQGIYDTQYSGEEAGKWFLMHEYDFPGDQVSYSGWNQLRREIATEKGIDIWRTHFRIQQWKKHDDQELR
ncbi:TPA: hypothetical protein HA265_07460 [Candidatus Woesearchaeota archaeon]|nr:hypothetical protein [Candidatus Woesearchaeota archaeon]